MPDEPRTLAEYLKARKPGPFRPVPTYSPEGDFLILYFEDAPAYNESLGDHAELIRSVDGDRVVGVKVFGVRALIENAEKRKGR